MSASIKLHKNTKKLVVKIKFKIRNIFYDLKQVIFIIEIENVMIIKYNYTF